VFVVIFFALTMLVLGTRDESRPLPPWLILLLSCISASLLYSLRFA